MGCTNQSLKGKLNEKHSAGRVEADWLEEGGREDDWTKVMMSALGLTAWESGRDVKSRLAAKHPGKIGR